MIAKFLVGVSAVIERDGKILLLKRSPTKDHGAGEWEPVSGRVEAGESADVAVKREVFEETKLEVEVVQPFDTFYFRRQPTGEELIGITYWCKYVSGEANISDEHEEVRWVDLAEVGDIHLTLPVANCIAKYAKLRSGRLGV